MVSVNQHPPMILHAVFSKREKMDVTNVESTMKSSKTPPAGSALPSELAVVLPLAIKNELESLPHSVKLVIGLLVHIRSLQSEMFSPDARLLASFQTVKSLQGFGLTKEQIEEFLGVLDNLGKAEREANPLSCLF